jgi:hypothetical protein
MTGLDRENRQDSQEVGPGEQKEETFLRISFRWVTLILTTTGAYFISILLASFFWQQEPWFMRIMKEHFAAFFGIPMATLIALAIVIVLRISAGPIEAEFSEIKLRGAAGEVLFWVICFLSVVAAIAWLW